LFDAEGGIAGRDMQLTGRSYLSFRTGEILVVEISTADSMFIDADLGFLLVIDLVRYW
jgi:hypothetical protein